ncbi:MAG: class II aldolase/adducin family protein [candidate division Zixibacteria bacterium]|nr:class II aldolase/adducin family protein [candidate division Zixibacteria bacterium]
MAYISQRRVLIKYGRLLYKNGLVAGAQGNLSIRLKDGNILITPAGASKGFLKEENLIVVSLKGKKITGRGEASSELLMHLAVYKHRPEIEACCHAHPPFATAFSAVGRNLPSHILPEVIVVIGEIPLAKYAPPGTSAVPQSIKKLLPNHNAFILQNHGVLTIGRTIEEAYNQMEIVEHYAKIVYIAENIGKLNILNDKEVCRLERLKNSNGRNK